MMADTATATANQPQSQGRDGGPIFAPATDIYETKDAIVLLLEMPGADPGSLDVTLDRRALEVSARSTPPAIPQGYTPLHCEYRDGSYQRAFTLSDEVDRDRIDAVFRNGVLRLTLPKASPSPAKKIAVKTA